MKSIKKIGGLNIFIMNEAYAVPKLFIQLSCQRFHESVVFLAEHFLLPLFYNFNLVAVRFFFIKSTDTFYDMILPIPRLR